MALSEYRKTEQIMSDTNTERAAKIAAIRDAAKAKLAQTAEPQTLDEALGDDDAVDVETFIAEHGLEGDK
jgi:hypothetical protein